MERYLQKTIHTYDQIVSEYVRETAQLRPQPEFEAFCNAVRPHGLVADAGCAWGRDCKALMDRGFSTLGVDLSEEMLKYAREYAPGCLLYCTDVRRLPAIDGVIDGVWCCATLLHLKRAQVSVALTEFHRALRSGGVCYVQVKGGSGEETVRQAFAQNRPRYFTYFSVEEVSQYFETVGFNLIDLHTYNERERNGAGARDQQLICVLANKH